MSSFCFAFFSSVQFFILCIHYVFVATPSMLLMYTFGFRQIWKQATKVCEIIFFDMQKYIYSESVFNILYIEIKQKSWKISFGQNKLYKKMPSVFFRELKLITVLLLIWDFYMSWSTRLISLKLYVRFSIFDSVLFLLKFILLFNKMHGLFDFKTSWYHSKL